MNNKRQNLFFAFIYNLLGVQVAAGIWIHNNPLHYYAIFVVWAMISWKFIIALCLGIGRNLGSYEMRMVFSQ